MLLAFNVGNTHTALGLFEDDTLVENWRMATRPGITVDELGLLVRGLVRESGFDLQALRAAAIASVVPAITPALVDACERHVGVPAFSLDGSTPLPIRLDLDDPLGVGPDRIANAIAAAARFRRDTITIDLGTATTFDCITGDGVFIGGVIAPGAVAAAEALVLRTARLPRVELRTPPAVIGRRTDAAVLSGVFHGATAAVDGTVDRILAEWARPDVLVLATGGLAPLLAPHCRTIQRVEKHLTLHGLQLAYRHAVGAPPEAAEA